MIKIGEIKKDFDFGSWCSNMKKSKSTIEVEKEEVDDRGNIVNKKEKSLQNFNRNHKRNY